MYSTDAKKVSNNKILSTTYIVGFSFLAIEICSFLSSFLIFLSIIFIFMVEINDIQIKAM
jgi:hypothetical protein